jgi:hypothetical protein
MAKTTVNTAENVTGSIDRNEIIAEIKDVVIDTITDAAAKKAIAAITADLDDVITPIVVKEMNGENQNIINRIDNLIRRIEQINEPAVPRTMANIFESIKGVLNGWYPWVKFTVWILIGFLVWQFLVFPLLSGKPIWAPGVITKIDVNTPEGAAMQEMQNEPFRSDTVSRQTFGRIFDELDSLVSTGQIVNLEGYYDAFGKRMQESIPADRYNQWAGVWNKLALAAYRHGNTGTNVKMFNNNLQSAAAVVAGRVSSYSGGTPMLPVLPGIPQSYNAPVPPPPAAAPSWQYTPIP